MKQKKLVIYFITIAMLLLAPLPILNTFILVMNGSFKSQSVNKKNLFSTDNIESHINYFFYKTFNISLNKGQVIVGKDNFLFLGNDYDNTLNKTNGTYRPSKKEIDNWTNKLKKLQQWYEDKGIKFVIVIAPNKSSIYKEKLPRWMSYDGKTITDDIVEASNNKKINMLDLRDALKNKKNDESLLYYKTDTHWNFNGASIGYQSTIAYLNKMHNLNIKLMEYSMGDSYGASGDLSNFLKINTILDSKYENSYQILFKENISVCKGNIDKESGVLDKCSNIDNPIMGINGQPQYMINSISPNKYKLLFLCDSFGTHPSQLYNKTFNAIWKWHYGNINGAKLSKFISDNKPDIVIYQIVERALYNDGIVTPLPKTRDTQIKKINDIQKSDINDTMIFNLSNQYYKNNQFNLKNINDSIAMDVINNDPIIILNNTMSNSKDVILLYQIESSINTTFQLFYKEETSSNYNENDSYRVSIAKGLNNINLLIPSKYINNGLRIDLVSTKGKYIIKDFKIYEKK